jgi:hypothetical protein
VWRHADGGPDQTLWSGSTESSLVDAGMYQAAFLSFDAGAVAVPARCGDLLVLQITSSPDAGEIIEAFANLSIP